MVDADGSADPDEIPLPSSRRSSTGADFAKGTRFSQPAAGSHDITRLRRLGNAVLSGLVNTFSARDYTDLCYGYNAFWRLAAPGARPARRWIPRRAGDAMLWGDGFEIETLINVRMAQSGAASPRSAAPRSSPPTG